MVIIIFRYLWTEDFNSYHPNQPLVLVLKVIRDIEIESKAKIASCRQNKQNFVRQEERDREEFLSARLRAYNEKFIPRKLLLLALGFRFAAKKKLKYF